MLHQCDESAEIAAVVLSAYEAYSGAGYRRVEREQIPFASRILTVAIAYRMLTARPHRAPLPSSEVVLELCRCRKAQFDARVVEASVRLLTAH